MLDSRCLAEKVSRFGEILLFIGVFASSLKKECAERRGGSLTAQDA